MSDLWRRDPADGGLVTLAALIPAALIPAALLFAALLLAGVPALASEDTGSEEVTFTKDVLPIFQRSCQNCHRPGAGAPMSLLTYREARPWARSIQKRVVTRSMPPWHLDPSIVAVRQLGAPGEDADHRVALIVETEPGADDPGIAVEGSLEEALGEQGDSGTAGQVLFGSDLPPQ